MNFVSKVNLRDEENCYILKLYLDTKLFSYRSAMFENMLCDLYREAPSTKRPRFHIFSWPLDGSQFFMLS